MSALRIAAQLALYAPLIAIIGYFSTEPRYSVVQPGEALVRVSFIHSTERKEKCRSRTPEELAKLAPNMRAGQDCPRERTPLSVEIELDGTVVLSRVVQPSGLKKDGNAVVYQRMSVPAGRHRIVARLRDRPGEGFNHVREATVELAAGGALLIDFNAERGGFAFLL